MRGRGGTRLREDGFFGRVGQFAPLGDGGGLVDTAGGFMRLDVEQVSYINV